MSDSFPVRRYAAEVALWEQSTTIQPERRAALCIGQLKGFAKTEGERLLSDPISAQQLRYGAINRAGGTPLTGCTILCWHLLQRYGEEQQHTLIRVASELKSFQRQSGETIKDALRRHEMLLQNAIEHGVTHNNVLVHAIELLGTFKVSRQILPLLLIHTGGRIPSNNMEYDVLQKPDGELESHDRRTWPEPDSPHGTAQPKRPSLHPWGVHDQFGR